MKTLPKNAYGLLLVLDGYGSTPWHCGSEELLLQLLIKLPGVLGMHPLGKPYIERVDKPGVRGLSGFRFIMESHISIHTYIEEGFVTADIYSCKAFDPELAANLIKSTFSLLFIETDTIVRGRNFGLFSTSNK